MTQERLREILDKHIKWLNGEDGGERADLARADLSHADLRHAVLSHADLHYANFYGARLCHADLRYTDLHYTDLREADLRYASLKGVDLTHAAHTGTALNLQCPEEGSFVAYKKLRGGAIAKLFIPEDAKRSSATSRKCRASKATILAIYYQDGEEISEGRSTHDIEFIYRVGETVYPDSWDEDRWNECSSGIHFFITRKEAEEY